MSIANFEERALKVISQAVPPAFRKVKVTRESNLTRDLGFDSFAFVSLVNSFDEEFGVDSLEVRDDFDRSSIRTVADVLRIGREIVEQGGGA